MKIQEIISEVRRNPRQNLGKPDRRELMQYLKNLPEDVVSRTFVHSSTVDKIGINPDDQVYADHVRGHITGVYCWSAGYLLETNGEAAFAEIRPYQFIIELKEQPTVLTESLWNELWDDVYSRVPDPHANKTIRYKSNGEVDYSIPPSVKKAGAVSSLILKNARITSLIDPEGLMSDHPGEGLILSLSAIKHYKRFVNHSRPGAETDYEGNISDYDIYAHTSGRRLLDYVNRTNQPLSIEQEKKLLNLYPLSPTANITELNNLYARLQPYIDKVLIPNNQKFKLPELNNMVYKGLNDAKDFHQKIIKNRPELCDSSKKQYQEILPYLKYFSQ
jgi:hypothetical protein